MKKILPLAATSLLTLSAACSAPRQAEVIAPAPQLPQLLTPVPGGSPAGPAVSAMPKAVIYRTSRPAAELVPVQLSASGALISFPAPGDLTAESTPLALADGWWLDRRGVSLNTAFTRWSYGEYRAMKQAPTPGQIMQAIVPDIKVTECRTLDLTPGAAAADTAAVNAFIRTLR